MVKVFDTNVIAVGPEANNMIDSANMLILFGADAPADLAEFCFTIDRNELTGKISKESQLIIDNQKYSVTAVGDLVETNLNNLGHITISFDGSTQATLPGTLHVDGTRLVKPIKGTCVQIVTP